MNAIEIIDKVKHKKVLTKTEIAFMINGYLAKSIPDYQISAWLMAIYFRGFTDEEITSLTEVMIASGDQLDLSRLKGLVVDKHSTGGIGDKVTLILGPILAALGVNVVKMSGRGLGYTGGTIDKLESIPGFTTTLSLEAVIKQVQTMHFALMQQSEKLVPADKMIYALRDVTATVDSLPLIAASVMSKKIATGAQAILLDVKCGNGAFMKNLREARKLAKIMIAIGRNLGRDVRVEITSMNEPLGRAIGNKNEVIEAVRFLQGESANDLSEVVYSSAATLLMQAQKVKTYETALAEAQRVVNSGAALTKFWEFVKFQHGDVAAVQNPNFWHPRYHYDVIASSSGFIKYRSALNFGILAVNLGAGRLVKDQALDYEAGIYLHKKTGDVIKTGDKLFTLYASRPILPSDVSIVANSYAISKSKPKVVSPILERLS